MTTPEERDYIGEVIREDAAERASKVTLIACKVDESCGQDLERKNSELRQQLADVSADRDYYWLLLRRVLKSGAISCVDFEELEALVCAVVKPSAEVKA